MKTFVNFSNHKSELWSEDQKKNALKYGKIVDISFPNVSPDASTTEIYSLAQKYVGDIVEKNPKIVMVQGESTLVYAIVNLLREKGIVSVAACSERIVTEKVLEDGTTQKLANFKFKGFRQYF